MKDVVEEDCVITDSSSCSHYESEMVNLCRTQNSEVYVRCDRVQTFSKHCNSGFVQKLFPTVSFQLCS